MHVVCQIQQNMLYKLIIAFASTGKELCKLCMCLQVERVLASAQSSVLLSDSPTNRRSHQYWFHTKVSRGAGTRHHAHRCVFSR